MSFDKILFFVSLLQEASTTLVSLFKQAARTKGDKVGVCA
jgi:hypothetical protein